MFEILNIPLPDLPGGGLGILIGALAIVAALAMMAFGRVVIWRIIAAAGVGGMGLPLGEWLASQFSINQQWTMAITATVLTLAGAAAAKYFWAAILAALTTMTALLGLLHWIAPTAAAGTPGGFAAEGLSLQAWLTETCVTISQWLGWMSQQAWAATALTAATSVIAAVAIGLSRPLATRIVTTSLIGAATALGGMCLIIASAAGDVNFLDGHGPWVLTAVAAVMTAGAIGYQTRRHFRSIEEDEPDEDVEDEDEPKKTRKRK